MAVGFCCVPTDPPQTSISLPVQTAVWSRRRMLPPEAGVAGAFVDMGMTVLTMANCDVGQGIFALMRVRRGELANRYENEMMKELEKELW